MMTFCQWIKKFDGQDSPLGDIAQDIRRDPCFPRATTTLANAKAHIQIAHDASPEAIHALERAWKRYTSNICVP